MVGCGLLLLPADADAQRGKTKGKAVPKKTVSASQKKKTQKKSSPVAKRSASRPAARKSVLQRSTASVAGAPNKSTGSRPAAVKQPRDLAGETVESGSDAASRTKQRPTMRTPVTVEQLPPAGGNNAEMKKAGLDITPRFQRPAIAPQPLYIEGNVGLYMTAGLRLNYGGNSWPYDYAIQGKFLTTDGFVDNAARREYGGSAKGGYIIDDGYGIFSGGHMGAEAEYGDETYHLYAIPAAPEREKSLLRLETTGNNSYRGLTFELRGGYTSLRLAQDAATIKETSLNGSAKVQTVWSGLSVGAGGDLRLTTLADSSIAYGKVDAFVAYATSFFRLTAGGNFDLAKNSDGSDETKLSPAAELQLFPVRGVTAVARVSGGINPVTLGRMLEQNPYVEQLPAIRQELEKISYMAELRIEPWESFGLRLMGRQRQYDRYLYFAAPAQGVFAPQYDNALVTTAIGDLYWQLDRQNLLGAMVTYSEGRLGEAKGAIPYLPTWEVEGMYGRRFSGIPLSLTATLRYIGKRNDPDGVTVMEAVPLLNLQGRYTLSSHFDLTLELNNLLDRQYELWKGYAERGIFGAVGIGMKY